MKLPVLLSVICVLVLLLALSALRDVSPHHRGDGSDFHDHAITMLRRGLGKKGWYPCKKSANAVSCGKNKNAICLLHKGQTKCVGPLAEFLHAVFTPKKKIECGCCDPSIQPPPKKNKKYKDPPDYCGTEAPSSAPSMPQ